MSEPKSIVDVKSNLSVPKKYNVVFHNDDYTSFEFVIHVLVNIFHHSNEMAFIITETVHKKGREVAGTYTLEVAEQKQLETMDLAKANEFPLYVDLEEV